MPQIGKLFPRNGKPALSHSGGALPGKTTITTAVVALAMTAVLYGQGQSFGFLDPAFTQELFGSTSTNNGSFYLGGVAVLPSGDVLAAECVDTGTRLHRFSAALTETKHSTVIHAETILPVVGTSPGGCGVVYHPDGTLYLNMNDGVHGIANVDANTGLLIRYLGTTPGNAVGIGVDPVTRHIVYAGRTCVAINTPPDTNCTLYDVDPVTAVTTARMVFSKSVVAYVNGIYFEPGGAYLFISNRFPIPRVTVVTRDGVIVQHLDMQGSDPVGLGFSATSPKFVVTNNTDGSMTRFDFIGDDYTQVPTTSVLALFGYRGDLMQAGPDGCLYVTQGGARYDNGTDLPGTIENSLVRICGGFAPPPGVPLTPRPVTVTTTATATAQAGGVIQDTATLGGGINPTGTISFRLYGPNDATCTGPATAAGTVTVSGSGPQRSSVLTVNRAGTYRWIASYSGDANNSAASGTCNAAGETSVVGKASPTVTTTATVATSVGAKIQDRATIAGGANATGTLTFRLYGPNDAACTGKATAAGSAAVNGAGPYLSTAIAESVAGTYRWIASYSGDANNNPFTSACNAAGETSTVAKAPARVTTNASANAALGNRVYDVAHLTNGISPTGTIKFALYGPNNATCGGSPVFTATVNVRGNGDYRSATFVPRRAGTYRWTAAYSGDSRNAPVAAACNDRNESVQIRPAGREHNSHDHDEDGSCRPNKPTGRSDHDRW